MIRTETIGFEEAEEAMKALEARQAAEGREGEDSEEIEPEDGLYYGPDHRARRYKYLLKKKAQGEPFTGQEIEFLKDYMETREWELLFGDDEDIAL